MIVGYERPITSGTLRPSREACESCHYPSMEHHDSVAVKVHYGTDPESSESRTKIVLHTGMDAIRQGYTKGIHWHIQNEVTFASPDPQRREIPWVRGEEGRRHQGHLHRRRLQAHRAADREAREAGHGLLRLPQLGGASRSPTPRTPSTRRSAPARSTARFPRPRRAPSPSSTRWATSPASRKDREAKVDKLIADATAKAATPAEHKQAEQKFNKAMREILLAASFQEKGFSWKSFPNHTGHADTPGLLPLPRRQALQRQGRGDPPAVHALPRASRGRRARRARAPSPRSCPTRRARSSRKATSGPTSCTRTATTSGPECEKCHGTPLKHGKQGGNFCANPACHGRTWPGMDLTAEPPKKAAAEPAKAERRQGGACQEGLNRRATRG